MFKWTLIISQQICRLDQIKRKGHLKDKLRLAWLAALGVYFYDTGHQKFIKLILRLFCFAQRLFFPYDSQKRETAVIRLNWKDWINSSAYWSYEITSTTNREQQLLIKYFWMKIVARQLNASLVTWVLVKVWFFIIFTIWTLIRQFADK